MANVGSELHRGVGALLTLPVELVIVLVPFPFVWIVLVPPFGESPVCTPLPPPELTTGPVGVWYVVLCAIAPLVAISSATAPAIKSFFIIMPSNIDQPSAARLLE
jgi:hypothetical protein